MSDPIETVVSWCICGGKALGLVAIGFGVFSALAPQRSIALYQWIMARFNWRVAPIDERREIRTTRILGVLLVMLGGVILALLCAQPT